MVSWGQNTVHTFAPTPAAFGSPAPAAFGAPAPTTTSLFGAPSSTTGSSLFGNTAGTTTTTTSSTTSSSSLFGTPAPAPTMTSSLWGSTTYGQQPQQQQAQQQPQIPAQAALQAAMNASAQQEWERIRTSLSHLQSAYTGTQPDAKQFVAVVYNDLTPEQRQQQWLQGMGGNHHQMLLLAPERPPQIPSSTWKRAVADNPDAQNYLPVPLVGAVALQGRLSWQQDRATSLATQASLLVKSHTTLQHRTAQVQQRLVETAQRQAALSHRLLHVLRRVELARGMHQPLQEDERRAAQRLARLFQDVEAVQSLVGAVQDAARTPAIAKHPTTTTTTSTTTTMPDPAVLVPILQEQRHKLERLTVTAQRDVRDVGLVAKRVATTTTAGGNGMSW